MEIFNCLIIEDSKETALIFEQQLKRLFVFNTTVCHTLKDVLPVLLSKKIDLIFLDIHLGDSLGIDLLSSAPHLPPVIITTAAPEYASETYDIDIVIDFLVKPITDIRLQRAIHRALGMNLTEGSITSNTGFTFLKVGRQVERFDYKDIDYIEAYGAYAKIYGTNGMKVVNESVLNLENMLPTKTFRRVHKSYIININKITGFDHQTFFINKIIIPIGVSYRAKLEGLFRLFG
jgi:DNA-binding LytR/AlgR family response regulator